MVAFSNPVTDSTHVATKTAEVTHTVAHDTTHAVQAHTTENHETNHGGAVNEKDEVQAYIEHHLQDSHDFYFFADGEKGKHYGFSLPVILWDNGIKFFSSSKFHNEKELAEVDGSFYKMVHGKIYKSDAEGTITYDAHHHPTNVKPLDFSITKNVLSMLVVAGMLLFMFISLARSYKKGPIPTGFGRILEPLIIFIRDEVAIPNIERKNIENLWIPFIGIFLHMVIKPSRNDTNRD